MDNITKKAILSISHTSYLNSVGGLEKFIFDQSILCNAQNYTFISIYPITQQIIVKNHIICSKFRKWGIHIDKEDNLTLSTNELIKLLMKYSIHNVYIHSVIFSPTKDIVQIIYASNTKNVFYYVHDYKSMCSCHILMKNNKKYCGTGGPNIRKCFNCRFYLKACISNENFHKLFNQIPFIQFIFPSKIAEQIWSSMYDGIDKNHKHIIPHQKFDEHQIQYSHTSERLRIAYVGYKAFNKGWATFKNFVAESKKRNLPYDFYILGKTDEPIDGVKHIEVSFQKEGTNAMVNAIRNNKIDVAFLWSPWPETYSYTFFESYVGGAFIITNANSGNIAAQTIKLECGKVFENEKQLLSQIAEIKNYVNSTNYIRPYSLHPNSDFLLL